MSKVDGKTLHVTTTNFLNRKICSHWIGYSTCGQICQRQAGYHNSERFSKLSVRIFIHCKQHEGIPRYGDNREEQRYKQGDVGQMSWWCYSITFHPVVRACEMI